MKNIAYPYTPSNKTVRYVPEGNTFIERARKVAETQSTDHQQPTGIVIVKDGVVIIEGANQTPLKNKFLLRKHKEGWCFRRFLGIPSGKKYWVCPGCASSRYHGERVALKNARNNGVDVTGADVYLWGHWWCCKPCWDAMLAAGIRDVYLLEGSETLFNRKK